jgi:hypothetical protein
VTCWSEFSSDHAGELDSSNRQAARTVCAFAGSYRHKTAANVREELEQLFEQVVLLPVTREKSSEPALEEEMQNKLHQLCEEGMTRSKFRNDVRGLDADWEASMRSVLDQPGVHKHLTGLQVPLLEQVATVRQHIEVTLSSKA